MSSSVASFGDLEAAEEASTGEEAIKVAATISPVVVIVDLVIPSIGGVEAIARPHQSSTELGIVALSFFMSMPTEGEGGPLRHEILGLLPTSA